MVTTRIKTGLELLKGLNGSGSVRQRRIGLKYLPMVKHIVKRKYRPGYEFEDRSKRVNQSFKALKITTVSVCGEV